MSLALCACLSCAPAATRGPDAGAPRVAQPNYPVIFAASEDRRAAALGAWATLARAQGIENASAPELQSITSTVRLLPALNASLRLPEVAVIETTNANRNDASQTLAREEAMRESLRRFIISAAPLLGVEPEYVTLVSITDQADGTKRALYEQKPFLYPLRGGYGKIEIVFANDRRVLTLNSTAIPDAGRLRRLLALPRERLTAQQAAARLANASYTFTDSAGAQQTRVITPTDRVTIRELVVLPLERAGTPPALEVHLAWEASVGEGDLARTVYVDATTGEILRSVSELQK